MARLAPSPAMVVVLLLASLVILNAAPDTAPAAEPPVPLDAGASGMRHGGSSALAAARVDTSYLLGGPDRLDGRFEDAHGAPTWHGWTHRDETYDPEAHWQVSDHQPLAGPYSMWCGTIYDDGPGYGNSWDERLLFRHAVADPGQPATIHWAGLLRTDTEPGYDHVHLEVNRGGEWENLASHDGQQTLTIDQTIALLAGEYAGDDADEIQLRVRFESDGAWSDEDGLFQSEGACWLDELVVSVDGTVVDSEDFDDQDPGAWQQLIAPGVGDFAQLYVNLQDFDPCVNNYSSQVAFVDDGVVVPGTGGSEGITWRYGPGGYVVNTTGGLMGPDHYLSNTVESPVLAWPDGCDAIRIEFDVYRHEELGDFSVWPGIFYNWDVRSTSDPINAPITDQTYTNRSFIRYGGPIYGRHREVVTDLMAPGRTQVQMRLTVNEYGYIWGWVGNDATPAPYFDNVAVLVWPYAGPAVTARSIDLASDGFPASGTVDLENLGDNSVRFDMARNISPAEHLRNDPGDSLVVDVAVVSPGAELLRPPRLYVRLRANPLFDPHRQLPPGFTQTGDLVTGHVEGDSAIAPGGHWVENRWAFDLPDTGFFYPGDRLHYLVEAGDVLAGQQRWTTLPADTTGFTDFGPVSKYDPDFVVRALPSVHDAQYGDQPDLLVWDDTGGQPSWTRWLFALRNLGLIESQGYDLYVTRGATSGVGNGLGGRATSAQLAGYDILLYTSGDLHNFLLGHGDFATDPSNDLAVLQSWFAQGGKNALFAGDNLASNLLQAGAPGAAFLNQYLAVNVLSDDVSPFIGLQVSPGIITIPGNGVIVRAEEWTAYGGCPDLATFDCVTAAGSAQRLAEFANLDGDPGAFPYAAATYNHVSSEYADIVYLPHDLAAIRNAPGWSPPHGYDGIPARAVILADILERLGHGGPPPPIAAEAPANRLAVQAHPNPFNPRTTIALDLPRAGETTVRLYDLRGALVRELSSGPLPAGRHELVWDGRDGRGRELASGVYFVEVRALEEVRIEKLTLIR